MPLTKKDYLWAETGTQTTPSVARQQSGWVNGEQPTAGDENWIQYLQDLANRELQVGDNPETTYGEVTEAEFAGQNLNNDSTAGTANGWGYAWSPKNIYNASTTADTLEDLAVSYVAGQKRIFALETNTGEVQVFDPLDVTLDFTISNATLVAGLPTTTGAWLPLSMCADDTHLFILFEETGVGAGTERHYVQSYDNDGTGVNSSWPATGTQITTGVLAATSWTGINNRTSKIIVSSPSFITTLNGWVGAAYSAGYSASTPLTSTMVKASGGLGTEGGGDVSSIGTNHGTLYPFGGLVADGNTTTSGGVYFTLATQSGATNPYRGHICSAQVGALTVGTGYTVFPLDFGLNNVVCHSLVYDGDMLTAQMRSLTSTVTALERTYHFDPVTATTADYLTNDPDYPGTKELATDGINLYMSSRVGDNPGGAHTNTKHNTVLKIDAASLFPSGIYAALTSAVQNRFNLEKAPRNNSGVRDTNVDYLGPMLFDGRDVWVIQDIRDGATYTFGSKVYRIPRVAVR